MIAADHLRSFVERIERLNEEIKGLNDDKSEVFKEARSMGFDVKTMREVIKRRAMESNDRDERDALLEMYWSALHSGASCAHVREEAA